MDHYVRLSRYHLLISFNVIKIVRTINLILILIENIFMLADRYHERAARDASFTPAIVFGYFQLIFSVFIW
jgi:hypothetical protein